MVLELFGILTTEVVYSLYNILVVIIILSFCKILPLGESGKNIQGISHILTTAYESTITSIEKKNHDRLLSLLDIGGRKDCPLVLLL